MHVKSDAIFMLKRFLHPLVEDYRVRVMLCLAASLTVLLAAVRLWPAPGNSAESGGAFRATEQEAIEVEEIQQTRQADAVPPPPAPPIPILVPDDVVLDEVELDFSAGLLDLDRTGDDPLFSQGPAEAESAAPSGPTVGPKTVRFVEPEYTREARRKRIRAELVVRVLVDEKGRVKESEIVERFLLDRRGAAKTPVDALGYGLEEAALAAADRWIFRPARKDGKPVESRTTLTFTFGVDA